jgi:hypothetical protein
MGAAAAVAGGVRGVGFSVVRYRPGVVVDGVVVDASGLLALRASMIEAGITERLRAADLTRVRLLYRAGQNVSAASLETAQAAAAVAVAREQAVRAQVVAMYGAGVAAVVAAADGPVARIAAGDAALVAVAVGGGLQGVPPADASARDGAGAAVALRYVGMMAHAPAGLAGMGAYYVAPVLPAGLAVAVRLPAGAVLRGYRVPASAVIYRPDLMAVFVEMAPDHFTLTPLVGGVALGGGRGYFVPVGALPHDPVIAVAGAGLLLSIIESPKSAAAPDDD